MFLPLTPRRFKRESGVGKHILTPIYCHLANSLCETQNSLETRLKAVK
jgi:hypothetical protein